MELYLIAGGIALAAVAVLAVMRYRRRRTRRTRRRGAGKDPHLTWVEDLKRQVAGRQEGDDTQPWSRRR